MPPAAYALLGVFSLISIASGVLMARLIGPWRWWSALLPALAAFASLYLVGHRLAITGGPQVELFGFRVSLALDLGVALATAGLAALIQRAALGLLQPQQRDPGRDGLA